jgi:hypothetical protein
MVMRHLTRRTATRYRCRDKAIGVAARLDVSGKATLGPPSEGLDLTLTSRRLDAPGEFKALMTYVPATDNPACRRPGSPSTARARSTISRPSSTSPPARTSGRMDKSSSRDGTPDGG